MGQEYYFEVPGKEGDEPIVIFARRHIISFLGTVFYFILAFVLPLILWSLNSSIVKTEFSQNDLALITLTLSSYYLVLVTYFFIEWINYYYDILIVTTKILYDIEQKNFFLRQISHVHLLQIEDISSEIKGFFQTLFAYGNVIIQTAGSEERTVIKYIANPQETAAMILKLHKIILEGESEKSSQP